MCLKAEITFYDVCPEMAYDVMLDVEYRNKWDKFMLSMKTVGCIDPHNDVCYYASGWRRRIARSTDRDFFGSVKSIPSIKKRDFVLHRSWASGDKEKWILGGKRRCTRYT